MVGPPFRLIPDGGYFFYKFSARPYTQVDEINVAVA